MYFDSLAGADLVRLLQSLTSVTSMESLELGVPLRHSCPEPEAANRMMMGNAPNSVYVWTTDTIDVTAHYDVILPAYDARNVQIQLQKLFPQRSFPTAV
jgi:hypothetical protein